MSSFLLPHKRSDQQALYFKDDTQTMKVWQYIGWLLFVYVLHHMCVCVYELDPWRDNAPYMCVYVFLDYIPKETLHHMCMCVCIYGLGP